MAKTPNHSSPYQLDGKIPLKQAIPLGLQHVLAMFVGNLSPLLIIKEPEGGIEPALQLLPDLALGRLPVLLVNPAYLKGVSLDQLLGGPKPVIANRF